MHALGGMIDILWMVGYLGLLGILPYTSFIMVLGINGHKLRPLNLKQLNIIWQLIILDKALKLTCTFRSIDLCDTYYD